MFNMKRKIANVEFKTVCKSKQAFTIVEVAAALLLLSMIISSVLVLMNRYSAAVIDMQLRQQAFELVRTKMETILSLPKLSDLNESGTSDVNPELEWQTVVEPFYEPVTERMWIRAVCSAEYVDSKGEYQNMELEHWITNLTAEQVKQILDQQKIEDAYLELLQGGKMTDVQETTRAFLEQEGLNVKAYDKLIEQQRRKKLEYIVQYGLQGYEKYLEGLEDEENAFLEKLGMDFDGYNDFAETYVPTGDNGESLLSNMYENSAGSEEESGDFP